MSEQVFSSTQLLEFTKAVFLKCGMPEKDATLASNVLLEADLRGIDSHGVARLSGYVRLFKAGRANPTPKFKWNREKKSAGTIDADGGLGLVSAPYAMQLAIEKAKETGSCFIGISNSNHFGIAAYHSMLPLQHDMIGWSMTNASPLVAPTGSSQRMLGTNPICVAFPAKDHEPFVLDMATAAAANGKLEIASRNNKSIPEGWVQTKAGQKSTNPDELKNGGALLPLGTIEEAGHKGYGLAAMVDLLCGVLPGANYGPWVPPFVAFLPVQPNLPGKGIGHFVGALSVDAFTDLEDYYKNMKQWIDAFKNATPIGDNEVLVHGEAEHREKTIRWKNGIPLNEKVVADLLSLSGEMNVKLQ